MRSYKLAFAALMPALVLASPASGAVVYSQLSGTGLQVDTATVPDALDDVNFATGTVESFGIQRLSALTFGAGVAPTAATTAVVFFDFWDNYNPAATGAVESTYLGGFGGNLTIAANTGTGPVARSFSFSGLTGVSPPIDFADNNIAVEISFYNAAVTAYSTIVSPLSSVPGTPTVGSSLLGSYRDAAADDFTVSDFSAARGNLYLSLTTISVPEPTGIAGLGVAAVGLVGRRRRRSM